MRAKVCKVIFGLIFAYMLYLLLPVLIGNAFSSIFWGIILITQLQILI